MIQVHILTPEKTIFKGMVQSVGVPGEAGEFFILKDHEAIVAALVKGKVSLMSDKFEEVDDTILPIDATRTNTRVYELANGGVAEFSDNKCIILSE